MAWKGVDPGQWAREQKEKLERLQAEVVQGIATEMSTGIKEGGLVTQDTGNLVNSTTISQAPISVGAANQKFAKPDLNVQDLKLPGKVYLGWRAPYAHAINYGRTVNSKEGSIAQGGAGFAEAIAAKFPQIVEAAVKKVNG